MLLLSLQVLAEISWNRLKGRWIELHLVLPRLNPGEGDRELFMGGGGGRVRGSFYAYHAGIDYDGTC